MDVSKTLILLIALYACILSGCGDSNRAKLVGSWVIAKPERVMSRIDQESDGKNSDFPDDFDTPNGDEEDSEPRMLVTFYGNGTVKTKTAMGDVNQQKQGTWKMVAYNEEAKTMTISCEINTQTTEHEVNFVDENSIELVPPNMAGLTMKVKFTRR